MAGCSRHGPAWFSFLIRLDSQLGTLERNPCSAELTSRFHWQKSCGLHASANAGQRDRFVYPPMVQKKNL